jgi:tetratricopeptide (TPR) repeat protein
VSLLGASTAAAQLSDPLAEAQELLDADRPEAAVALLDGVLQKAPKNAQALLLRSTARFALGALEQGEKDLDRALELDPALRQGWLNLAALRIAEERYADAREALIEARELDPNALDNDLNLGVVDLLRGELESAGRSFERYVERSGESADAYYVVASNYAMSGYAALALRHLEQAVEIDERTRVRARTDPNFGTLTDDLRFQKVLNTDPFVPPPGSYSAGRRYEAAYAGGEGPLLGAVIDAMRRGRLTFSPRIEVTPNWALIFGELRVKVTEADGKGLVEITAPPDSFAPGQWQDTSERLFHQITYELAPKLPGATGPSRP